MQPLITSILDTDAYKLSMQRAVLQCFPKVPVKYKFINRRGTPFTHNFGPMLQEQINHMADLRLTEDERSFLAVACPFLGIEHLSYLKDYRYDPSEVSIKWDESGRLEVEVAGLWERTILWEVPLMALISELYFMFCDTNWTAEKQDHKANIKGQNLRNLTYADFGTRRRRSYASQANVVNVLKNHYDTLGFIGTSNVHLAHKFCAKPIGTMAHEWIMGVSAMEGLRHANRYSMKHWSDVYRGNLGIMLTDTFRTNAFFEDFDGYYARLFDGVRHDSGDPIKFGDRVIDHYHKLRIDPETKTIVFSDGLDTEAAKTIALYFKGVIKTSFGIGTHLTNDYGPDSPALNMVIKMTECNGVPVIKLSDAPGKETGDRDALRVAKWTFDHQPLDN